MLRIWVQGTTKSTALGPSGAFSVLAHAALIGGAVFGTGRAADALQETIAERIYFLPPPDRVPDSRPSEEHVRYIPAAAGVRQEAGTSTAAVRAGDEGTGDHGTQPQRAADEALTTLEAVAASTGDSVYSVLQVDEGAVRIEGSGAPVYPATLLAQHVEGTVRARYVIDTTGHTDPQTLEILTTTHPEFTQSVRDAIPLMRFHAGIIAGRRVRQLVEQNFVFRIAEPVATPAEHTRATPPVP